MNKTIVAVIGAGSVFTPELVGKIAEVEPQTGPVTLRFYDIDASRRELMSGFCRRQLDNMDNTGVEIVDCEDAAVCLDGAAFILLQLRQGGLSARVQDEALGKKYKIPFTETISICGFASFLRTYYEYERLFPLFQKYAPDASTLNFTNPSGQLSEALYRLGHRKVVGVCNAYRGMEASIERTLGIETGSYMMNWRGLNHLTIVDGIFHKGENRFKEFLERSPEDQPNIEFYKSLGAVLNGYYQYYFNRVEIVNKQQALEKTRSETVCEIDSEILKSYKSCDEIPSVLSKRGGAGYSTAVVDILKAILLDEGSLHYAVVKNGSALPRLPRDAFVEVPVIVNRSGTYPLTFDEMPPFADVMTYTMKTYERTLIAAAMERSKKRMFEAMMIHPLMNCQTVAAPLLDDFIAVNNKYLPDIYL